MRCASQMESSADGNLDATDLSSSSVPSSFGGVRFHRPTKSLDKKEDTKDSVQLESRCYSAPVKKRRPKMLIIRNDSLVESDLGNSRFGFASAGARGKSGGILSICNPNDKHSRKGLQAMVQKRKKLLKYLRRTDWDSYCFCLSELELEGNTNLQLHAHKGLLKLI
ncbi:hypothetical protein L1987_47541 [Smallanthus sonchifolius]|uniref:Uncharacterized protein n=1 Tax=Smallanthus sonchifolius TaxID=185202 RepID=A0ACB9G2V5_9ASTR|nr:hypothetical protein L1987_47541 [Smallanthus sonchifolius]